MFLMLNLAKRPEKSGLGQIEPAFDAFQADLHSVHPEGLAGKIAMERGDLHLQRRDPVLDLEQVSPNLALLLPERAQMLKDEVVGRLCHGDQYSWRWAPRRMGRA